MSALTVGESAPSFRLPSGQGGEVGLDDHRGHPVILWFTKGMACAFCRQQMSQLARVYPEIRARGGEVLEITATAPDRARFYVENFRLPFPYLCDVDYRVHAAYGLRVPPKSLLGFAQAMYAGARTPEPRTDFGPVKGVGLRELSEVVRDTDMGFFVVDGGGIVRHAHTGSYTVPAVPGAPGHFSSRPIPGGGEILGTLDRCRAA